MTFCRRVSGVPRGTSVAHFGDVAPPKDIQSYMTPNPRAVTRGTTVREAIQKMEDDRIRHLLVMDGDNLSGMVSRRELDLLTMVPAFRPENTPVELAMTPDPYHVDADDLLKDVAMKMAAAKIGSAVVTKDGAPVGIFTTIDALVALGELAPAP